MATEVVPSFTITCAGERNPARAALSWLLDVATPGTVDVDSFEEVAVAVGEIYCKEHPNAGFVVKGLREIELLCQIGGFQIIVEETGIIHARKP